MQTSYNAPRLEFHPESGDFYFPSRHPGNGISAGAIGITYFLEGKQRLVNITGWKEMVSPSMAEGVEGYET